LNEHQLSLELASEPAANAAITVGLFFGGRSAEHAISLRSAATLCVALREAGCRVVPIGIERSGPWRYMPLAGADFPTAVDANACAVALAPGRGGQLMACEPCDIAGGLPRIDVAFPALHGPFGEDGRLQGLFETCGVPYVGAGVPGGAVTMDKELTKRLLLQAGLPVVPYRLHRRGRALPTYAWLSERLGPRLFVKPASLGSSIGANPAHDETSLAFALAAALEHDDTVLVERRIDGRELECGVIEIRGDVVASLVGEIATGAAHPFYDYEAKYLSLDGAVLHVPSNIDTVTAGKVRELAREAFDVLRCRDLARVDFFLDAQGQLFVNEVNALPGFTSASLYPRMFEASGLPIREQVRHLVESALARS
jgi:D-alanine-D-alanine ligase